MPAIEQDLEEVISVIARMWSLQSSSPQFGAVLHIPPSCTCCLMLIDCTTTDQSARCRKSIIILCVLPDCTASRPFGQVAKGSIKAYRVALRIGPPLSPLRVLKVPDQINRCAQ